jgi:hypothetical protein
MNEAQYLIVQKQLVVLAAVVQEMPLAEFLSAIDTADTLGPILDPTRYLKASEEMHNIESLARALMPFKKEVAKHKCHSADQI